MRPVTGQTLKSAVEWDFPQQFRITACAKNYMPAKQN